MSFELDGETMQKLMAYADGELDEAERSEMETLIAANANAARLVAELGTLGECVRVVSSERSLSPADGIADAVMAEIAKSGTAAAAKSTGASSRPARVGDLAARRRRTYGLVAGLVAAAAAVVIVARVTLNSENEGGNDKTTAANTSSTVPKAVPPVETAQPATQPTAVASLEPSALPPAGEANDPAMPSSNVSVIVVPSEGETAPSVVIWLGEESPSGGPIK